LRAREVDTPFFAGAGSADRTQSPGNRCCPPAAFAIRFSREGIPTRMKRAGFGFEIAASAAGRIEEAFRCRRRSPNRAPPGSPAREALRVRRRLWKDGSSHGILARVSRSRGLAKSSMSTNRRSTTYCATLRHPDAHRRGWRKRSASTDSGSGACRARPPAGGWQVRAIAPWSPGPEMIR
jgi:hypothetical protein